VKELSFRYQKPVALCYFTEEENRLTLEGLSIIHFTEPDDALSACCFEDRYHKKKILKEKPLSYSADHRRIKRLFKKQKERKRSLISEAFEVLKAYEFRLRITR